MGRIYVVGLGPGAGEQMTLYARKILKKCPVIVGYTLYVELIREAFPGKQYLTTPMRQEIARCRMAIEAAEKGGPVAVVCSGDPGVYGMAGLLYEICGEESGTEIEIVPGVTAANGGAACLGAPLMHDFAVVSLSDLLTPWEEIADRLRAAACTDFVICLYNPGSRKRSDFLKKACHIIGAYRGPHTVCGLAVKIGREGEYSRILTLEELEEVQADMFTTVYIGNSRTKVIGGKMVTPRGYQNE